MRGAHLVWCVCVCVFVTALRGTAPTIVLVGSSNLVQEAGEAFSDPGARASDAIDGVLDSSIVVSGTVNVNTLGTYTLTYKVTNSAGRTSTVQRHVVVADTQDGCASDPCGAGSSCVDTLGAFECTCGATMMGPTCSTPRPAPVITIHDGASQTHEAGEPWTDAGVSAQDVVDGDLTDLVTSSGSVDGSTLGTYKVHYTATNTAGLTTTRVRTVEVVDTEDACAASPCDNGACYDGIQTYTCDCSGTRWRGDNCEIARNRTLPLCCAALCVCGVWVVTRAVVCVSPSSDHHVDGIVPDGGGGWPAVRSPRGHGNGRSGRRLDVSCRGQWHDQHLHRWHRPVHHVLRDQQRRHDVAGRAPCACRRHHRRLCRPPLLPPRYLHRRRGKLHLHL